MEEPDILSDNNVGQDSTIIPQIVLTRSNSITNTAPTASTINDNSSLLPPAVNKPNNSPPLHPLPLTIDLLKRKNKLDKLLLQKEKKDDYFSNSTAIDKVTAGLGISTPNNNGILSTGLRSRRSSSSRLSITNDMSVSPPVSPSSQQHSEWSYDLDVFKSTTSGSSIKLKGSQKYTNTHTGTTMSDSSIRNSLSMKAYSAYHRYMDRHDDSDKSPAFERPIQTTQRNNVQSKYYLLDVLYQSAIRVVNSRAPESSDIMDQEKFKFDTLSPKTKNQHNIPLPSFRDDHTQHSLEYASNEKMVDSLIPESTHNKNQSLKNRFSLLSNATSFDYESASFYFPTEKKEFTPTIPIEPKKATSLSEEITPNPLQGNSLFVFSPNNPIRIFAWKWSRSRNLEAWTFFLLILHWILLACMPITSNQQKTTFGGQWTHYPIFGIQCFYSFEMICKIIAYGFIIPPKPPTITNDSSSSINEFIKHHRAYLNSFGNCLDMISISSYWIDFALMKRRYPYMSLFKSLGAFRPIRLLSMLPGTAVILKSLETSWELLLAVAGLIVFFIILFALMGLISFQGVFSRRCYYFTEDNAWQLVEPPMFCSGYKNGTTIVGPHNTLTNKTSYLGIHGYICSSGQICMEDPANTPNYGYTSYDSIFHALLSVYTFVSLELWTDQMYQTQQADSNVAALFYCLGVYIISFVLTFLLFAVVTSAFARVRADSEVSAFTAKKKGYPILRDAEGINDEAMWLFDNMPDDGKGVTTLKLRWWIVRLVNSKFFTYLGALLVFLNLIIMCLRSFNATDHRLEVIDNAETVFTFIFAIEILLRMIGSSNWISFWVSRMNLFDLFLVVCTCVIQLPIIQDSWVYKYLTIFQTLRIYRLFFSIPRVRRIVSSALGTGESVIYVMVFLVLATALCATVFMQMFGGDYDNIHSIEEPEPRFDTFWESFVALIVVYTSERWTNLLYDAMESQAGQSTIYAAVALSLYFAFGRYIMSALYIAVVLENFELDDDYIRHYQIKDFIHRHRYKDKDRTETLLLKLFHPIYSFNESKNVQISRLPTILTAPLTESDLTELLTDLPKAKKPDELDQPPWLEKKLTSFFLNIQRRVPFLEKRSSIKAAPINPFVYDFDEMRDDYDVIAAEENREAQKENRPIVDSLLIFSDRSRIRYYCKKLVGSSHNGQAEKRNFFNWFVMACVLLSILMVVLDEPSTRMIRRETSKEDIYNNIEVVLSIIFIIELSIRIIADGLLLTPHAYLRDPWNQLDFCVIILNIVTIFMASEEAPRGLSTFRSLRILRLIRYFNGVRDIFVALFYSLPLMFDALIFTFLVLIPFAIYGINIFGGRMWLCNDESVHNRGECVGEYLSNISSDEGIDVFLWTPRTWQNPQNGFISFDNFQSSLQHLFSLTSTEGWVDSMFHAMSTPSTPDMQPEFSWNSTTIFHSVFYIIFMIISQGTIQLFVGVIIEKFKERNGITTLTTAQRQYADLQRLLASVKPTIKAFRPESKIRQICYDIVIKKHGKFNRLIIAIIVLNIVTISSEFYNEPHWLMDLQDYSYLAFTIIYVLECIIKLLGIGWKKWIRSLWNWLDFLIATAALSLLIVRFAFSDMWTVRIERYCLILTAFRLGEGIDALQTLYHAIAKSLPSIVQVSVVFMVVMCLFAIVFMEFFGLTKYGIYGTAHSNFRDYGNALLLLVRATTGEAWNAIIIDYTVQSPNCVSSGNYFENDCGSPFWAYFLFDLFYIICTHILMNLFTAVIISNFEYAYETRTRFTKITKADLRLFKYAWADIDVNGTGYIQKEDLAKFLRKLTGKFQLRIYDDAHSISNIMKHGGMKSNRLHVYNLATNNSTSILPKESSKKDDSNIDHIKINEINKHLSKMDLAETRKRRLEYNLYYKEILRAETPKGIPFTSVLTILSYRFIDISTSLTLDPLIARLEKIEQLNHEYRLEKAAGFFETQIQKKRFIRELWKKRDEDEVKKLGIATPNHQNFSPLYNYNASANDLKTSQNSHNKTPVPRIVIDTASLNSPVSSHTSRGSNSIPTSPASDNPFDLAFSMGADSLIAAPGTASLSSSPNIELDSFNRNSGYSGGLSPLSLMQNLSPGSRQNWLLIDGNNEMPREISEGLMDSMNRSIWSDMLRDEDS